MQGIEEKYPHLFRAETWPSGPTTVHFRMFSSPPPERLISNVNFVPFIDDRCVIIQLYEFSDAFGNSSEDLIFDDVKYLLRPFPQRDRHRAREKTRLRRIDS